MQYIHELPHCTSFSASSFQEQLVAIRKLQSLWFTSLPEQIFLSANDSWTLSQLGCDYGLAMYHWLLMFDWFSSCFSGRRSVRSYKPRRKLVEAWHRPTWVQFGGLFVSYSSNASIRWLLQHVTALIINPLNAELNPICHLLALLAHHIIHISRIRVKLPTYRCRYF